VSESPEVNPTEPTLPPDRRGVSRRQFVRAVTGLGLGSAILGVGILTKLFGYLSGATNATDTEHTDLLRKKLARLRETVTAREQELERMTSDYIEVAKLSRLNPSEGKYFIDYNLRAALAFADDQGLPLLISAKCTHLGCTDGNSTDDKGRISCPCHMSFFDLKTGAPNQGSPAKSPLPHIGWVLKDEEGKVIASKSPKGEITGKPDPDKLDTYTVFIAKQYMAEEA
jgi:Rieske Fe-S protein